MKRPIVLLAILLIAASAFSNSMAAQSATEQIQATSEHVIIDTATTQGSGDAVGIDVIVTAIVISGVDSLKIQYDDEIMGSEDQATKTTTAAESHMATANAGDAVGLYASTSEDSQVAKKAAKKVTENQVDKKMDGIVC